jgi:hypothetical protein
MISQPTGSFSSNRFIADAVVKAVAVLLFVTASSGALAQDVRWSWFEVSFVLQDISEQGTMASPVPGQTVDIDATDGNGIKFRASLGTWKNLFAFVDFNSSDITVDAVVTNSGGMFPGTDEFDYTAIRGGVGLKWSMSETTDIYGAVSYDSADFDFGSFAGEDFDTGEKDVGAEIGFRSMFGDKFEFRLRARFSNVGVVDLSTGVFDSDTLFGIGFGYELIRGLSIVGDYETGGFSSFNIGFRLDLSED